MQIKEVDVVEPDKLCKRVANDHRVVAKES